MIIAELHETDFASERVTPDSMLRELRSQGFDLRDRYGPVCVLVPGIAC